MVVVLAFRLGRVRVCGLVFRLMIILVSFEVTAPTIRAGLISTLISVGTSDVLCHVLRNPNVSVCCLVAPRSCRSIPGDCVAYLERCSGIMASAVGRSLFSRAYGYVAVLITCIVCSRDAGSSTATAPVTVVVGAGGVICRERLMAIFISQPVSGLLVPPEVPLPFEHIELPAKLLDYFLRSNKSNINQFPVGICSPTVGSAMSTSTSIDSAVTVAFVGKSRRVPIS